MSPLAVYSSETVCSQVYKTCVGTRRESVKAGFTFIWKISWKQAPGFCYKCLVVDYSPYGKTW